jgi:hypothetical protein
MVCNYLESFVHSTSLKLNFWLPSLAHSSHFLLASAYRCIALGVVTVWISSTGIADETLMQDTTTLETVVVTPVVLNDESPELDAPTNAEVQDDSVTARDNSSELDPGDTDTGLRVAKRPWLLEKLVGPEKDKTVKMDAPRPPVGILDPPSLERIEPPSLGEKVQLRGEDDRWISRKSSRIHARPTKPSTNVGDLRPLDTRRRIQSPADTETPRPLTDVSLERADRVTDLRPLQIENSKPLKSFDATEDEKEAADSRVQLDNDQSTQQDDRAIEFDYAGFPKQPIQLTRSAYQMRSKMHRCLRSYYSDMEIASGRSNWGMMHAMMVYGIDTKVIVGRRTFSTIAWIAGNNVCRGQRLFDEENGQLVVKSGVGLQGHDGQLLAVFSLCGVPDSYPIYAGDGRYAVQDIVKSEMLACKSGDELTFILIALSHYLDTDQQWLSADGESWDFERLIREELSQPVVGAACGGTHRLMGFGHALRQRRIDGKPIKGQWLRAEKFTEDFVQYVYRLQNRDGSFSTDWFEGRQDNGDLDRKIQTTGHMVEWLLTVTPNSQLQNPRLMSAVRFLLNSMYEERDRDWSIGPKGHALRSLTMFHHRVYQSPPPWQNTGVASRSKKKRRR